MPVSVSTSPSIELVREELEKAFDEMSARIVDGSAKDFAEYRYMVGFVRGLAVAVAAMRPKDVRVEKAA